jgi:hypothetical protein
MNLYTQEQYNNAKFCERLPFLCPVCQQIKMVLKKSIHEAIRKHLNQCCSPACSAKRRNKKIQTNCVQCNKQISVKQREYNESKHNFCSKSCRMFYSNLHKVSGSNRSKLEHYIEGRLKIDFPNIEILSNDRSATGLELDIYIPSIHLAFELNGIFHYEPIFSHEKLIKTQNTDKQKIIECYKHDIELCIINTCEQTSFTEKTSQKYYFIIKELIKTNLNRVNSV